MRFVTHVIVLSLVIAVCHGAPARAEDMLVAAMKRISELEAKNIALEINQRRLEEINHALEVGNRKIDKSRKEKPVVIPGLPGKSVKSFGHVFGAGGAPARQSPIPAAKSFSKVEEINKLAFDGLYIGLNAGYGGGDIDVATNSYLWSTDSSSLSYSGSPVLHNNSTDRAGGALAGLQFGYNRIFSNRLMLGAELDFDWADIATQNNSYSGGFFPQKGSYNKVSSRTGLNWLSTERIRVGYAFGSLMPYLTGGLAISQAQNKINASGISADNIIIANVTEGRASFVGVGWSAGAGIEYLIQRNLSLKSEYLYTQTPSLSLHSSNELSITNNKALTGMFLDGSTANLGFHQIRIGLNYRPDLFNSAAPAVIAKY